MGVKKKDTTPWTEERIQQKLRWYFMSPSTKKYELFGRFVYDWESDYLAITKSGYVYECEIKISRADFHNDFKNKVNKHLILEDKESDEQRPNYLYYAVPEGLISPEEVPNGYGLLYVSNYSVDIIKPAEKLHKNKVDIEKLNLIDKFYYGYLDYWDKYIKLDVNKYKKEIGALEKDCMFYDDELSRLNGEIDILKLEIKKLRNDN